MGCIRILYFALLQLFSASKYARVQSSIHCQVNRLDNGLERESQTFIQRARGRKQSTWGLAGFAMLTEDVWKQGKNLERTKLASTQYVAWVANKFRGSRVWHHSLSALGYVPRYLHFKKRKTRLAIADHSQQLLISLVRLTTSSEITREEAVFLLTRVNTNQRHLAAAENTRPCHLRFDSVAARHTNAAE